MPETGTFLTRDPWEGNINRPDTLHGYIYANNNPIMYKDASGLDYIPWLDRYTCDDPRASSGYAYQYDQATGTWGLWPCIVDPNNVTTQGPPPSSPPPLTPSWPSPGNPNPPLPPNGGCPLPNPKPTEPLRFELRYPGLLIPTEIIVFPPDIPPVILENRNQWLATSFGVGAAALDGIELVTSPFGYIPDAVAVADVLAAVGGSYFSGESYARSPHPSLPPMVVLGQDVLVASFDGGIAFSAKSVLPALGVAVGSATGLPHGVGGGLVGYLGGQMVDVATTSASLYYDIGRLEGTTPTLLSYAIFWEGGPRQAILLHAK